MQPGYLYEAREASGRHLYFISSRYLIDRDSTLNLCTVKHLIPANRKEDSMRF